MDAKLFNWTNKKKLVMLKHVVSMVINKAILRELDIPTKILTSNAFFDTKLGIKLMLCRSTFT